MGQVEVRDFEGFRVDCHISSQVPTAVVRTGLGLTLSEKLDTLTIDRLPILIGVGHEETLEMFLDRTTDHVDSDPLGDTRRLDITKVLKRHLL